MDLASVVRMERDDLPWIPAEAGLQGNDHIHLCFRAYGSRLEASSSAVGDGEGPAKFSRCLSSVMTHEIHLYVPGRCSREFPEGDHRDETQETPGFGPGTMLPVAPSCLLRPKQTVHGGRPHLKECGMEGIRDHGSGSLQGMQELRHCFLQSLPTESPAR